MKTFIKPLHRLVSKQDGRWTVESRDGDRQFTLSPEIARGAISWRHVLRAQSLYLLTSAVIAWDGRWNRAEMAWRRYWKEFSSAVRLAAYRRRLEFETKPQLPPEGNKS